jgi:hypothetical protein
MAYLWENIYTLQRRDTKKMQDSGSLMGSPLPLPSLVEGNPRFLVGIVMMAKFLPGGTEDTKEIEKWISSGLAMLQERIRWYKLAGFKGLTESVWFDPEFIEVYLRRDRPDAILFVPNDERDLYDIPDMLEDMGQWIAGKRVMIMTDLEDSRIEDWGLPMFRLYDPAIMEHLESILTPHLA